MLVSLKEGHQIGKKVALKFPSDELGSEAKRQALGRGQRCKVRKSGLPVCAHGDFENPSS